MPRSVPTQPSSRKPPPERAPTLAPAPRNLFAGTSGWAYATWKPGFYPASVRAKDFLRYYSTKLNSVEVNYTFRKLCEPNQLEAWLNAVPQGFRFSFKAPQRITHFQRLLDCEASLTEFFASIATACKVDKLGLVLFQLPPNFKADPVRLQRFLALPSLRKRNAPKIAFEFRHESWFDESVYTLLRNRNAALCIAESDTLRTPEIHTAETHRCYRLRCAGGYKPAQLRTLAAKYVSDAAHAETFVYFKHEDEPTGANQASSLLRNALHRGGDAA